MGTLTKRNWGFLRYRDLFNKIASRMFDEDFFDIFDNEDVDFVSPRIDVSETQDKFILTVELPGMTPDDFKIEVTNDAIIISGEKKNENKESKERYHLFERRYGSFERRLRFPTFIDKDRVASFFKNGVLKLEIPKKEITDGRKIIEITEE
jgi:HSP20 family protein